MKKVMIVLCATAILCGILCGCGSFRNDSGTGTDRPAATMDLVPEVSPVLTPDPKDGVVTDRDGIIEERESAAPVPARESASPSPAVSAKP